MYLTKQESEPLTTYQLNELYMKGWELISSLSYHPYHDGPMFIYYFKRIAIKNQTDNNGSDEIRVC